MTCWNKPSNGFVGSVNTTRPMLMFGGCGYHWQEVKIDIVQRLRSWRGSYRFSPMRRYVIQGEAVDVWGAQDALVQKAMTIVLEKHLNPLLSQQCYHVAGRGGLKGAVRHVQSGLRLGQFFFRSDVLSYYASLDHNIIRQQFAEVISDKTVLALLDGFLNHLIDKDGLLIENKKGVPRGSALSPLIGAMYLQPLDDAMAKLPVRYCRFMDDWLIVADTRWKQRRAIGVMNEILEQLKVSKHPDKTDAGHVEKGINFLGYRFSPEGLTISQQTLNRLATNILQLQEQQVSHSRLAMYWRRFLHWSFGGLRELLDWKHWLSAALEYFGKEDLLNLLQRCSKKFSPPLDAMRSLLLV